MPQLQGVHDVPVQVFTISPVHTPFSGRGRRTEKQCGAKIAPHCFSEDNIDEQAFVIMENTLNVLGKGFSNRKIY